MIIDKHYDIKAEDLNPNVNCWELTEEGITVIYTLNGVKDGKTFFSIDEALAFKPE